MQAVLVVVQVMAILATGLVLAALGDREVSAGASLPGSTFEIDGNKAGSADWAGIGGVTVINDQNSTNGAMTVDGAHNQNCSNNTSENIATNSAKIDQNPFG